VRLYRDRLGLRFEIGEREQLSLVFTQVDEARPEREFSLAVRVVDGEYEVLGCDPALPALPQLTAELGAGRNFAAFVRGARRAFQAVAAEEREAAGR